MPATRQKNGIPSRRRREDDGEEEEILPVEVDDDSVSEGSVLSHADEDADAEGSDASGDDEDPAPVAEGNGQPAVVKSAKVEDDPPAEQNPFQPSLETDAMLNGLKNSKTGSGSDEIHFDDMVIDDGTTPAAVTLEAPSEALRATEKNRLEHREYLRQRDTNPAFVPNRGGFFLHDDRSASSQANGFRPFGRGRGRGLPMASNQLGRTNHTHGPTEQPWAHDLHETVARDQVPTSVKAASSATTAQVATSVKRATPSAPNRSFSISTVLGNVTVRVFLPGMPKAVAVPNVVKQQHTLLPQHRPPLRRDKPVRISIPDQSPRYIFPSTERSFIFIPRAMRPNQQGFVRGRGRGSFHGSRRTSMFGGSVYSPSIAMSRKSSAGGATPSRADLHSPAGSTLSRQAGPEMDSSRPIVRMPATVPFPLHSNATFNGQHAAPAMIYANQSFSRENQANSLPMHQPRPQKTVSIADIESPASFSFKPPQQQQEQPFHQQVPVDVAPPPYNEESATYNSHSRRHSHATLQAGTPLSQIPETAIYAQPFHPYPMLPPPGYFVPPYPPGALFYPPMQADGLLFNGPMASSVMAPTFVPAAQQSPFVHGAAAPAPADDGSAANTVAHESNGMVYYYDSSQLPPTTHANMPQYSLPQPGGVVGIGGMMTPPAHFYYPQAQNGMYFAPH